MSEMKKNAPSLTYRDAGVDIDAGNEAVQRMKAHVRSTYRPEVLGDIGGFGGLFALNTGKYREPVLVSGTDGVGTKLRLAFLMDKHDTIGQDAVAMCVNDILVQGAEPLFFLDYLAVAKVSPTQVADIVGGIARACKESGCALIGGETAEMAGFYGEGEYDIGGFAVGVVEKEEIITGETIQAGDAVLGLPSSGVHSNGYSLVRKICLDVQKLDLKTVVPELGRPLGEELLEPTRLYPKACLPLFGRFDLRGLVHITGGGFYDNIPRVLPEGTAVEVDIEAWPRPAIFSLLQEWGNVAWPEMYRTFNMGIGMILVVPEAQAQAVMDDLAQRGETCYRIGSVVAGNGEVTLKGGEFDHDR
ncbi:phosphoribosylformylglycinamidine cyclo-ligase [uncultured Anaeromusa sp.]|uniref:phosphoribosylformylglycinamidine cyclo-ligase n=1 Tax=uncultured Anaeromusa sp. TaxID=673273 RepID=UPI0029C8EFFA|nr:phosphoribosylformylglycinamidine cyclo-ligase [uncultured Anaeromusa sp.]